MLLILLHFRGAAPCRYPKLGDMLYCSASEEATKDAPPPPSSLLTSLIVCKIIRKSKQAQLSACRPVA
jgi:hypothetical protein